MNNTTTIRRVNIRSIASELKAKGVKIDAAYEYIAGLYNMYGVFFGHKFGRKENQKLRRAWLVLVSIYSNN